MDHHHQESHFPLQDTNRASALNASKRILRYDYLASVSSHFCPHEELSQLLILCNFNNLIALPLVTLLLVEFIANCTSYKLAYQD